MYAVTIRQFKIKQRSQVGHQAPVQRPQLHILITESSSVVPAASSVTFTFTQNVEVPYIAQVVLTLNAGV